MTLSAIVLSYFLSKSSSKGNSDIRRPILKPYSFNKFELVEEYQYNSIIIPSGYKTNGANIPRIFWSLFPPNSPEYISAALVHDYLCDIADNTVKDKSVSFYGSTLLSGNKKLFKIADHIFKDMLLSLGVNKLKAYCFYYAVRLYHIVRYRSM